MKNKIYIIAAVATLVFNLTFGQSNKNRRANKKYESLSYIESIKELLKLVESGNRTPEVLKKLGNAYYYNTRMEEASIWYGELVKQEDTVVEYEYIYRYAMCLKAKGEYTEANIYMNKFATLKPEDSRSKLFLKSKDYLKTIEGLSVAFDLENLELNSEYSDFGTSFYKDGIVFASSRGEGKLYQWNEQPFLDLFYNASDGSEVVLFSEKLNTKYHESSTTFSKDGLTMYFTRNNFYRGKTKKSDEKVNGLKIFKATLNAGKWGAVQSMPFNSDDYNVAHPALNVDGTKLYFSSDMPGTLGKSDIYVVDVKADGTYGTPLNLGESVNTSGRENFPFISNNGTLYFSSDGHPGLGGLDIFVKRLEDTNSEAVNLAKPINSSRDDFEFIIDEYTNIGYLTSNRLDGKGDDDIYKFTREVCKRPISGVTTHALTNEIIPFSSVVVYNQDDVEVQNLTSDENGTFSYPIDCNNNKYKVVVSKDGFEQGTNYFEVAPNEEKDIVLDLKLKIDEGVAVVGADLFNILKLKPIYFDFDKSNIRPDAQIELLKIIDYLKQYPEVSIDVKSHTDSRGEDAYNQSLSERRNKSTKQWIINKGNFSNNRLTGKGYGESQLVNGCSNTVKCSETKHQENRRSMFIVTSN